MSDYQNGAQACRLILRTLPSIDWCASDSESQSVEEYFVIQQAAIRAILSSAGPMSEQAAGAMAVLAEFVVCSEQDASYYTLDGPWKPWAAMSSSEQQAHIQKMNELANV